MCRSEDAARKQCAAALQEEQGHRWGRRGVNKVHQGDEVREGPWMGRCRLSVQSKGRRRKICQELTLIEARNTVAQISGGGKHFGFRLSGRQNRFR